MTGNIEEHVVNLLNWYPQPTRNMESVRYVCEVDPMDIDRIKDLFGSKARDVAADALDLEAFETRADEPLITFEKVLQKLRKDGKLITEKGRYSLSGAGLQWVRAEVIPSLRGVRSIQS